MLPDKVFRIKFGGICQNSKNKIRYFESIFKHRNRLKLIAEHPEASIESEQQQKMLDTDVKGAWPEQCKKQAF